MKVNSRNGGAERFDTSNGMRSLQRFGLWGWTLLLIFAAGCVSERAEEIATLEGDPDAGAVLFSQHCIRCHGVNARAGSADVDLVFAFRDDEVDAIDEVLEGNFGMPNFGENLNDQEVADIAAYVGSLGG
jgi:mono/diheme cytochrome c family protein